VLNATEFIELEIEDQGDNNLQVEFAVGDANKVIPPLVFNSCSERLLVGTGREVDAALMNEEWWESRCVAVRFDRAFPFRPLGLFTPTIREGTRREIRPAIFCLDVPRPRKAEMGFW
jgi:hypothetical protein